MIGQGLCEREFTQNIKMKMCILSLSSFLQYFCWFIVSNDSLVPEEVTSQQIKSDVVLSVQVELLDHNRTYLEHPIPQKYLIVSEEKYK